MPLWTEQLQQASFRNVPFHVDTIKVQAGDNVVLREYPFADLPTVFRMGEGAEEIRFSAYVIGEDYRERREALRKVLTGEGVLVHPTAGAMRVYVNGRYDMEEAPVSAGQVVRFELAFVRAEPRRYPQPVVNTQAQAKSAAADAKASAQAAFVSDFNIRSAPGWVQERVVDRLNQTLSGVWDSIKGVTSQLDTYTDSIVGSYQVLRSGLGDLVSAPASLAGSIGSLFSLPTELASDTARAFQSAFGGLFNMGSKLSTRDFEVAIVPPEPGLVMLGLGDGGALGVDTVARTTLARLNSACDRLVETLATAAWVEALADADVDSYDQAMAERRAIYEQCMRLMSAASSGLAPDTLPQASWHDAMQALLQAALADLQARSRDQVRLTTFTPDGWVSIWSLSYRLFGTVDYADEIQAMNPHIQHPLLVPPGVPLRIAQH